MARAWWPGASFPTAGSASRGRCSRASKRPAARSSSPWTPTLARGRGSRAPWPRRWQTPTSSPQGAVRVRRAGRAVAAPGDARHAGVPVRPGRCRSPGHPGARARQRPVHGGAPPRAARRRRLCARSGPHDRRRGARPRARAPRLAGRVPRRTRARGRRHARLRGRGLARVGAIARAARRHLAGAGRRPTWRWSGSRSASRCCGSPPDAVVRWTGCCSPCAGRCWQRWRRRTRAAVCRSGSLRSPTRPWRCASPGPRCVRRAAGAAGPTGAHPRSRTARR